MGLWIKEEQPQVNLENLEQFISSNFTTAKIHLIFPYIGNWARI